MRGGDISLPGHRQNSCTKKSHAHIVSVVCSLCVSKTGHSA
ncbi:hypothetical protein [Devosia sp. DBB001]|nr:hypothetical protein [Devosia sp. DBB001]